MESLFCVFCTTIAVALLCSRAAQLARCLNLVRRAQRELSAKRPGVHRQLVELATQLGAQRSYGKPASDGSVEFDPRMLVFEFMSGFLLRRAQVELVGLFRSKFESGESLVHQMIMGAGK